MTTLCSCFGGHVTTAIQESIFSLARSAEGGVCASRGQAVNLSSRVFIIANYEWLSPIKGTHCRVSSLKRKGLLVKRTDESSINKKQMISREVAGSDKN